MRLAIRPPITGERARGDGVEGIVVLALPSRDVVIVRDDEGFEHVLPINEIQVLDACIHTVYLC